MKTIRHLFCVSYFLRQKKYFQTKRTILSSSICIQVTQLVRTPTFKYRLLIHLKNKNVSALSFISFKTSHRQKRERTCFALNWPKSAWCKDRWNVYTMYALQLICTDVLLFLSVWCSYTGMYFWYIWQTYSTGIKKRANVGKNKNRTRTRTNSFFDIVFFFSFLDTNFLVKINKSGLTLI